MKSGTCPKCKSEEVYFIQRNTANAFPVSALKGAYMDSYCCTSCGYMENYITNEDGLDLIRRKWTRVKSVMP